MHDVQNNHARLRNAVEKQVFADCEAPVAGAQFVATAACIRVISQHTEIVG